MPREKKEKTLPQPHDRTFEYVFKEKETAASMLKEYLPVRIRNKLDFDSLKISNDTFVDKRLKNYFADLLYEIKLKSSYKAALIYILFEHKSWEEWFTCLQLLKYMVRIWEQFLKQNKEAKYLPVIIPLVIYHGKPKWELSKRFISLFENTADLEEYIPDFGFNLYDISHMPDEDIQGTPLLKIFLTTFKYIDSPELRNKLWDIFKLFLELSDKTKVSEYLEVLLKYLLYSPGELKQEELHEQVTSILEEGGDIMQTIAQQLREEGIKIGEKNMQTIAQQLKNEGKNEGKKEGKKEGKREGKREEKIETAKRMLLNNFSVEQVITITGLTEQEVKALIN
jgi:predicted transposase/invertase (TIGR01784 family)